MTPKFYSPTEAADIIGCSPRTLRRAVHAGELAVVRINSRVWRFSAVDLAAWHASKIVRNSRNSRNSDEAER